MDHIVVPLRRIILLQGLEQAAGRELSNEILQRLLKANGQGCSLAEVNDQITWARCYARRRRSPIVFVEKPGNSS